MSPIYFGFKPKQRGATKQAVKTPVGELEPTEPSRFRIYSNAFFSPIYGMLINVLGLAVSIFSYSPGYYIQAAAEGLVANSAGDNYLPFEAPGLAVIISKGKSISQDAARDLDGRGFTTMQFGGKTLWLKEKGTRSDYLFAETIAGTDFTGVTPGRYLSIDSFRQFLVLRSLTTRIAEFFHFLSMAGGNYPVALAKGKATTDSPGWTNIRDSSNDTPVVDKDFSFAKPQVFKPDAKGEVQVYRVLRTAGSTEGASFSNSAAVVSPIDGRPLGLMYVTDLGKNIHSHGLLFKFNQRLASPDVNFIGDILGRYFLKALGDTMNDQFDTLSELKSGLSSLQLTRVGEELTHFYKCVEIAIQSNAGCVPIFSGSRYEGALVSGGPGATLTHNGESFPFQPVSSLKADYLSFSDHVTNLQAILRLLTLPELEEGEERVVESMFDLRALCLASRLTQSNKEEVTRRAAHLDFGLENWVINPAMLKDCFSLMSNFVLLDNTYPIGRLALFSEDPVLVALSCFGEKSCPSWDIPNGTPCSLKKNVPPSAPVENRKKGSSGTVSDAAWVMVIRSTDLLSAVEEFREMATTLVYRSSASSLAKKVGHRVFSRERMNEFWVPMRDALRVVNPNVVYEEEEVAAPKRGRDSTSETLEAGDGNKRRRLGV